MTDETIGQRIRRLRLDTELTQRELAHLLFGGADRHEHRVTAWEAGRAHPRINDLASVAAALHCSTDYLLSG